MIDYGALDDVDHSYLSCYSKMFTPTRDKVTQVLCIGVGRGAMVKMFHDYFENATIHAIHNIDEQHVLGNLKRLKLYPKINAYSNFTIQDNFSETRFDIIFDDGITTQDAKTFVAKQYTPLLHQNGILCMQDIANPEMAEKIYHTFLVRSKVQVLDLRTERGTSDDILIIYHNNAALAPSDECRSA